MAYAIKVEHLSKKYVIQSVRPGFTLRDKLTEIGKPKQKTEDFWALKDVSFEVKPGEVMGVIGKNGSGKSTLLKILSRITEPTTGKVTMRGRVASLLEVGTGFNPELSGRENIYLNGAILGMTRKEITKKFDEIVDFSGVEKFIDTPVKRYSSGMYVRLAFAVAAHLDSDILLVDEVLAVGDAEFQKKCLSKMNDLAKSGKTVLFVSHNLQAITSLCQQAILIDAGRIKYQGKAENACAMYSAIDTTSATSHSWDDNNSPANEWVQLHAYQLHTPKNKPLSIQDKIKLTLKFSLNQPKSMNLSLVLWNFNGIPVFNVVTSNIERPTGKYTSELQIPANFLNDGHYYIQLMFVSIGSPTLNLDKLLTFSVSDVKRDVSWFGKWVGAVRPKLPFKIIKT